MQVEGGFHKVEVGGGGVGVGVGEVVGEEAGLEEGVFEDLGSLSVSLITP